MGWKPSSACLKSSFSVNEMRKCIVASDSFKGTLSSTEICGIARRVIAEEFPSCEVVTIPVADVDQFLEMIPEEYIDYVGNSIDITKDELPEQKECWVFDRR